MIYGHRYARTGIIALVFALFLILTGCSSGSEGGAVKQQASGIPAGSTGSQRAVSVADENTGRQDPPAAGDAVKVITATVTSVADGDTMHVKINSREEKVRLIGVNTPEISHQDLGIKEEPYGKEAAAYTQKRLAGRQVYLELDVGERDKYGRLLAYVWLEKPANGSEAEVRAKMYNAELLLNGYAQVMTVPPNVKYADLFIKLQQEARQAGKGLWGATVTAPAPIPAPGDKSSSAAKYIGNSSSKKFHLPSCQWAKEISPRNRVEFTSRQEAISAGYQPCKVCRP
ncbi:MULTISPECIES: thermonuclease family protein [unclassified Neomoorella]|uniref:thermonuclease family protein n=1 Tax=unclassified Neomoorella TaxID=2676739 RepID=UPI00209BF35B|nr:MULTISPECIES: thermonuclease family protein [unclassified Moorella (in: firmicutes)]